MTKKKQAKQWAVGDRCYVMTFDGVRCGRIDALSEISVRVLLVGGYSYWAQTKNIHEDRFALDVAWLLRELSAAKAGAKKASKASLAADKWEQRALSKVATLEERLAAAKAKVTK